MRLVLDKIEEVKAGSPKLKEFAGDLADTIKSTYSRVKTEVKNSGAGGSFKQGFLSQFGINEETVTETEAKKKKAQGTEGVTGSTALEADKLSTPATPDSFSAQASAEKETEANEIRQTQLEKQTKTQEDITALYVISDDFFKETKEHQTKLIEKLEELIEVTEESGGGGGTGIGLDDLVGRRGGARPSGGGGGGTAGKVLKTAKTAAVTAAVVAGGGYVVDAAAGALGVGKDKDGNDLQVDEKQDDANWNKMSTFDKVQSGAARGIEKVGSFFFMDNLAREAQATRIKKETEILNAREGKSSATGTPPPGSPPGTPPSGPSSATGAAAPASTTVETSGPGVTLDPEKKAKDPAYTKIFNEELQRSAGNRRMAEKFADQRYIKEGNKGAINPTAPGSAPVAPTTSAPVSSGLSNEQAATARTTAAQTDPRRIDTQTSTPGAVQTSTPGVERPVAAMAPKTVEQLAMDEAKRFGRSTPNAQDKQAAQMLYRNQAAGGASEANLSGVSTLPADRNATVPSRGPNAEYTREEATREAARLNTLSLEKFNKDSAAALGPKPEPAAPRSGGQLQQATTGVANAESDAADASGGGGATNIVAPSNSTVVNNNQSAPSTKDTRNNESTFQRYLDRRYYPTAAR